MKSLTAIFVVLVVLMQYPLWFGKGSWFRVWNLNHQIEVQKKQIRIIRSEIMC